MYNVCVMCCELCVSVEIIIIFVLIITVFDRTRTYLYSKTTTDRSLNPFPVTIFDTTATNQSSFGGFFHVNLCQCDCSKSNILYLKSLDQKHKIKGPKNGQTSRVFICSNVSCRLQPLACLAN